MKHTYKYIKAYNVIRRNMTALAMCLVAFTASAQELNCRVEVNAQQIEGTNKSVFTTLQEAVSEYMNTTVFTNAQFAANEKIDCQLYFTIKEYTDGIMKGDLQIQATRPVYNTAYTTTTLNFRDTKIDFAYEEGNPLIYNVSSMESQLTAILDYYAFLILAIDFDTFAPSGGQPYWDRLKQIVQWAQSSGEAGWKAFEDTNNRSAVLSVFTDPQTAGIRELLYNYHRKGLDEMSMSPDKGRAEIHKSLGAIEQIYKANSMSVGLSLFKDTKMDELVNIYSQAPQQQRTEAYNLLEEIYPSEQTRLNKIKNGQEKK